MSYFESACTESEYLDRLFKVINGFSDGAIIGKYMTCTECDEIIINLHHAKYHNILKHGADWKKEKQN